MENKDNNHKRDIDHIREGACYFDLSTPDDDSAISGMVSLSERLLVIKENGIYEFKFADQIDPERKNVNTPNTAQQVLAYGSSHTWVGATVLTGKELLRRDILENIVDAEKALELVIEIAQNIVGAIELKDKLLASQEAELQKYDLMIKPNRSFILPSMKGVHIKCKEFLQRTDHSLTTLFKIVKVFYPDIGQGAWDSLKKKIEEEKLPVDNFKEILAQMMPFLHFVRNARNCVEHPRNEQKIVVSDFSVDAQNTLIPPLIEVFHPNTPQPSVPIIDFMNEMIASIINIVELMIVFLCNRHIRPIKGFPVRVHEFPAESRRTKNVKFGYGVSTGSTIIPFG